MKYELSEKEFLAYMKIFERIVDVFEKDLDQRHQRSLVKSYKDKKKSYVEEMSLEEDSEFDSSEDIPMNFEDFKKSVLIEGGKKKEEAQDTSVYVERGKEVFGDLVKFWLINFDQEGEQPDRAEYVDQLSRNYDGRAIIHYMESVKGLTRAIWKTGLVEKDDVRKLAGNMTQVTSASNFYQLSTYLEHPDPTLQEDFFNV